MEQRKIIRRKKRTHKRTKRLIASFLVLAMLSAASISAVAFALTAEYANDVYVPYAEEVVAEYAAVEEPAVEYEVAYDTSVTQDAAEGSYDYPAIQGVAEESYEAVASGDYIEIEPLSGISPGDVVAIYVDGTPANDRGYPALAAAISSANPGETIYFLGNVAHIGTLTIGNNLTLDFRGYNLNIGTVVVGDGVSLDVINGGTLHASGFGLNIFGNSTVNFDGNISASSDGIRVNGAGADVTINGNVSGSDAIRTMSGSTSSMVINGNISGRLCGIHANGAGTIIVTGNIHGNDIAVNTATGSTTTINASGDVSGGNTGIRATTDSTVNLIGDVTAGGIGINASQNANVWVTGDVVATGANSTGAQSTNSSSVRITGTLTAPNYVRVANVTLAADEDDETSTLPGYKQFSRDYATVWVLSETPLPPTCECTYADCPCTDVPENCTCGTVVQPPACECTYADCPCPDAPEGNCTCGAPQLPCNCDTNCCECSGYNPDCTCPCTEGCTPDTGDVTGNDTNGGDDANDDDEEVDEQAATGDRRDPAAGPKTGDVVNWFAQIAVLAALLTAVAATGLVRTRGQN